MEEESVLKRVWRFLMPVLIAVAIVFVVAGASFLLWGEFSFQAYIGILCIVASALVDVLSR